MPEIISGTAHSYMAIGERAEKIIGRHFYRHGVGFGRIVQCQLVWANVAHITIQKSDGTLVSLRKTITI